ncbi:MFS transporter [Luethyella okanaganae]|uniref:MFS transporter n=1 Tax=Luethyella okanaganae TaxID=69372 RepID=A0ABW1VH41_9MICO
MPGNIAPSTLTELAGRRAQAGVVAVFFAHGLLFASWTAHIPFVKAHIGMDDGMLGVALLGIPAGSLLTVAVSSAVIPRLGSRRLVQLALVGSCLAGPFVGLTGSVLALFGALLVWGLFQGLLDIAMTTQAVAVEKARDRPIMNGMQASWSIGAFVGAATGTAGVALGTSLTLQLIIIGAPALVVGLWLSTRMLTDVDPAAESTADAAQKVRHRVSSVMLVLGGIAFATLLLEGAVADWSSVYLRESLDGGPAAAGLGYTSFALAMVIVRLFGNRLTARFPVHVLLPILTGVAAVVFASALLIGTVPAALIGFLVLGLGCGTVVPTVFSAAGRLQGTHPGFAVTVVSGIGWVGIFCGPPLIGLLSHATSLPAALWLIPVLTALIAVGCRYVTALRRD